MCNSNKEQGIALVQVLLITGVISILLISLVKLSQQQLNQARTIEQAVKQDLALTTAMNRVQYRLLTENWSGSDWRFYGSPHSYGDMTLTLQSTSGLVNLFYDGKNLTRLLEHNGVSTGRANRLTKQLMDWQKGDEEDGRHLPIQHIRELEFIGEWTLDDVKAIEPYVHSYPTVMFNASYSPDELLPIILTDTQAALISKLRQKADYTNRDFERVSGIEPDEFTPQSPGPIIRINLVTASEQRLMVDVAIRPYDNVPLMFYQSSRAASERSGNE
ncbi:MAG: hypothetical protein ACQEVQ_10580 [Pseudomonadota bacterium]